MGSLRENEQKAGEKLEFCLENVMLNLDSQVDWMERGQIGAMSAHNSGCVWGGGSRDD